jgi:DNA primase
LIPESFTQDLLARVDVVDIVGRYVQLRKGRANLLGLCPFHNEKSPSFTVSPTKQFYHCFGCGAHGSAITFLMEHTGSSFPEAVRTLAASAGMTVPEGDRDPRQRQASAQRKAEESRHIQVMDAAQLHYLQQLRASPAAISYLKQRGLTGKIARHFGLGWSGTDRHGLSHVFPNYDDSILVETGLVIESEDGRRYDRFRERIMFPIRNARGSLIGFGGRIIGKGEPKYLNLPETPLFTKGHELYGLWEARQEIRKEGMVIVVEGYMDVVGLAQQGVSNAVATLGTATTPDHVKKLLHASDKVIFSFDGDKAGQKAAWRALQACLPALRDDITIRFLFLPPEHDPDSYVRELGGEAFRAYLGQAVPLSKFLLDELASRHVMTEAEGRASCLHEAKPLLGLIPECALRVQIEREMAKLVQLTPEEMSSLLAQQAPKPFVSAAKSEVDAPAYNASSGFDDAGFMPDMTYAAQEAEMHYDVSEPGDFQPAYSDQGQGGRFSLSSRKGKNSAWKGGKGDWKKNRDSVGGFEGRRVMPSLAKRLLGLLLAHPELVDSMGDQQLEVLDHGPHLGLVRDLILLAQSSGARHVGALLEAAQPGSDLEVVLKNMRVNVLSQEDLPHPQREWDDALRYIEFDAIKREMSALAVAELQSEDDRQRYQELSQRMMVLKHAGIN